VFVAPEGANKAWSNTTDVEFVEAILEQVQQDLCIDLSRVFLEGFSQGGAMVVNLACALPGVFRAVAVHSGGGVPKPASCEPIPYFASLGDENEGVDNFLDLFVNSNSCTPQTPPQPPNGTHQCYDFADCAAGYPVRWCPYGGGHTAAPTDTGESQSWMPDEVWEFFSQF
jgi:pimeloyl-ACP methyl ester carboxylesterase